MIIYLVRCNKHYNMVNVDMPCIKVFVDKEAACDYAKKHVHSTIRTIKLEEVSQEGMEVVF